MEDSIKTIIFEAAKELAATCEEKDYIVSNAKTDSGQRYCDWHY